MALLHSILCGAHKAFHFWEEQPSLKPLGRQEITRTKTKTKTKTRTALHTDYASQTQVKTA
jgi:hypothetical protein